MNGTVTFGELRKIEPFRSTDTSSQKAEEAQEKLVNVAMILSLHKRAASLITRKKAI
jgi:hypothetical protein